MKLNPLILIIIVGLGVFVGLNINEKEGGITKIGDSQKQAAPIDMSKEITEEEKQRRFTDFYNKLHEIILRFEDIDESVKTLSNSNPSRVQAYETFSKLAESMEEGQKLPLGTLIPEGFTKEYNEIFNQIIDDLSDNFQYRKFAYEHFLNYINTDNLEEQEEAKQWLRSAHSSQQSATISLVTLKAEIGVIGDNTNGENNN